MTRGIGFLLDELEGEKKKCQAGIGAERERWLNIMRWPYNIPNCCFFCQLFALSVGFDRFDAGAVRGQKPGPSGVTAGFVEVLCASTAFAAVPWRGFSVQGVTRCYV